MSRAAIRAALARSRSAGNGWRRALCPLCLARTGKADRKGALSVSSRGYFECHKCDASGWLEDYDGAQEQAPAAAPSVMGPPDGFGALCEEPLRSAACAEPARAYLRSRGLPEALWREAGLGAVTKGFYAGRVVVPVKRAGAWLGWVARAWTKQAERTYLYPRGMQRGSVLYNEAALDVETDHPVLVVEGVFDALALWPHAVAVLGKPSRWQEDRLLFAHRPVSVVLDGDAHDEGWAFGNKLALRGAKAGSVKLPPKADPDEVDKAALFAAAWRSIGKYESEVLR